MSCCLQASTSKTPCPGAANKGASPAPSLAHLFPPSPHAVPSTLATVAEEEEQQPALAPSQEHVNSLGQISAAEQQEAAPELLQKAPNAHNSQAGGCPAAVATALVNSIAVDQTVASAEAVCGNDTTHASEDRAVDNIRALSMPCIEAAVEAAAASTKGAASEQRLHMQFQAEAKIAEDVSGQAAESQQGQKRGGKAKRPPKPKHSVRKKQTGKPGRAVAQQDENADSNKAPHQQSESLATSAVSDAKEPLVVSPTSCEAVTNPPASLNAADPDMAADKEPR